MSRTSLFVSFLAVAGLLLFAGCSANQLGNSMYEGKSLDLLQDDMVVEGTSNGENLNVRIKLSESNVCEGDFKLAGSSSAYPPIWNNTTLKYTGQFKEGLSPGCQKATGGPGGRVQNIQIQENVLWGDPWMQVCSLDNQDFCIQVNTFRFEKKESS